MASFDPESFLDLEIEGANDTRLIPIPVGEYIATVEKGDKVREIKSKDGTDTFYSLPIVWRIDDPSVLEATQRDKVTIRADIFLDILPSGALDMGKGKNVQLGKYREALGLNDPTRPFSMRMFINRAAKIKVGQRAHKETGELMPTVQAVTAA